MSLVLFTSTSLYNLHMKRLLQGVVPVYMNFLLLFIIMIFFAILFYITRNSKFADFTSKPLNLFFLLLMILGVLPHSEYPPFTYFQNNIFLYDTSFGPLGSFLIANIIITFILIIYFISLQDKIDYNLKNYNLPNWLLQYHQYPTYFTIIVFGFISLSLSFLVYGLSMVGRYLVPTLDVKPLEIIIIFILVALIVFYSFNYLVEHHDFG